LFQVSCLGFLSFFLNKDRSGVTQNGGLH
jgi:hypothetical protein